MSKRTVRAAARTLTPEPRFRVAHLFQDEALRSVFRSAERSMPEVSVLLASSFAQKVVLDEDGFIPAPSVLQSVIDKHLSELRYRKINGVMTKDDRQTCRALEKIRANLHKAGKEASR
jgi:hypothetical protein